MRRFELEVQYTCIISEEDIPELANVKDTKDLLENHPEIMRKVEEFGHKNGYGDTDIHEIDEDGEIIN